MVNGGRGAAGAKGELTQYHTFNALWLHIKDDETAAQHVYSCPVVMEAPGKT